MPDKPSLYVVEKKEVIILVVLFVLVTVLSFTLGVRYGESVGKKVAHEQEIAAKEHGDENSESGTLGKVPAPKDLNGGLKAEEHANKGGPGEAESPKAAKSEHDEHAEHGAEASASGSAGGAHGEPVPAGEVHSPELAAKSPNHPASGSGLHEAAQKDSDEYLLNALKNAGVEPPGGKAPKDAKLPEGLKEVSHQSPKAHGGSYVIQVGSHPTLTEAESQVRQLKAKKLQPEILPPFKDHQGEWHRVVVGSYKSKRDAEREANGLKGKGLIVSFFVWRLP